MSTKVSIAQAKAIVQKVTKQYGFLRKELMDRIEEWDADARREIDENWLNIETALSNAIKTLASEIYGSGARFVFELLQNADDNLFSKAIKKGHKPFITFKVYKSRIVIDCNENGFTEKNLNAICSVGQSTKSAEYGYIGAKGIGFKSVFIVAEKVCIQSGSFTFKFEHKKHEPGIGMVRPLWFDAQEQLAGPLTRTTLHLHSGKEDTGDLKQMIVNELADLKDTCLLFLKKLKKVTVEHYDDEGRLTKSTKYSKTRIDEFRVGLNRKTMENGETTIHRQVYHITTQKASGLAWSVGRSKPSLNTAAADTASSADVVLAFPLTEDFAPMCKERQQLFAFLPLRTHDYRFIIHSDFDTTASRQDIVITSQRNISIRKWIASTFVTAVLEFCKHEKLCYEWPAFLPDNDQNNWDSFWASLNAEIAEQVAQAEVLKSRNFKRLRRIQDVRILDPSAQLNGEPLFDDYQRDPFISRLYTASTHKILKAYGLKVMVASEFFELIKLDLNSTTSRMQDSSTAEWHSAVAKLLCAWFEGTFTRPTAYKLKSLPLLPMRGGTWRRADKSSAYFPTTGGMRIPNKLGLEILDATACANTDRRALFRHLGVSEAEIQTVRTTILAAFNSNEALTLSNMRARLHFLYLTHPRDPRMSEAEGIWIFIEEYKGYEPEDYDIYLRETVDPYSANGLLSATELTPGFPTKFVHPDLMIDVPLPPEPNHPTWERWLYDYLGVRERIRMISRDGESLSEAFEYVLNHRPGSFLGLFESLWRHERETLIARGDLRQEISGLPAANLCNVEYKLSLKNTWFPLDNLKAMVNRYTRKTEIFPLDNFPFLKIDAKEMTNQADSKWKFLWQYFSIKHTEDLAFLLTILACIQSACSSIPSISLTEGIFDLYVAIATKHAVQQDSATATKQLTKFFSKQGILVPGTSIWAKASECVWKAPANLRKKHSLRHLYRRTAHSQQMMYIEQLFHSILKIAPISAGDITEELEALKSDQTSDATDILRLYEYLDKEGFATDSLRRMFNANALIMVQDQGQRHWYKPVNTLWSSSTPIRGKATLDVQYDELMDFFVTKLGVKSLTLEMVYDELLQKPQTNTQEDIRVAILALSNFLRDERTSLDPKRLREAQIFPVKYATNEPVLRSAETAFAIADRGHLEEKFRGKAAILNFDMEDVNKMRPFFSWLALENRFLSNSVKEITSVQPNAGRPIRAPGRDLCRKAYYILRLAATYGSPRYSDDPSRLYDYLRNAETLETDDIHVTLQLAQNEPIEDSSPNIHIDDGSENMKVYVPRRKGAQAICFGSILPRKLLHWLMRYPNGHVESPADAFAISTLTSIFAFDRHVLDEILDRHGIIQIDVANEDPIDVEDIDDEDTDDMDTPQSDNNSATISAQFDTQTLVETVRSSYMARDSRTVSLSPPVFASSTPQPMTSFIAEDAETSNNELSHERVSVFSHRSPYLDRFAHVPEDTDNGRYRALLERVVTAARAASFPSRGAFNLDSLRDALFNDVGDHAVYSFDGGDVAAGFRSESQLQRDIKVGAAGELYVFELFSTLALPGWGRDNWQSTIRRFAREHPQYADLEPWNRRETADFVYSDEQGELTNLLIGAGYLAANVGWEEASPKYFLEVKSTTSRCETPFYMSSNQFALMQSKHGNQDKSEVYMILRVFGLNGRLGMCAYLDPERLRLDGQLLFTGQSWSIVPGAEPVL